MGWRSPVFFNSDVTDTPSDQKKPMFINTNQPLITSFYIKRYLFFAELAMSQRWSAIFCATGVWGGKTIRRVRVKYSASSHLLHFHEQLLSVEIFSTTVRNRFKLGTTKNIRTFFKGINYYLLPEWGLKYLWYLNLTISIKHVFNYTEGISKNLLFIFCIF